MDLFPDNVPTLTYLAKQDIFTTVNVINYLFDESRKEVGTLHILCWELNYTEFVYERATFEQFIKQVMHGDEGFTPSIRRDRLQGHFISNATFWKSQIKAMVLFKHFKEQKKLLKP